MNALRLERQSRKSQPALELLDLRLAPTSFSMGAVLPAELKVEARQVHRQQVSLESARPGSRHSRLLIQRIATEERVMTRQEARLDRIDAPAGGTTGTGSQSSLPSNFAVVLDVIYDAYERNPAQFPANLPATDGANLVEIQGSNVGIEVQAGNSADFATLQAELQNAGMQVTSPQYGGTIVGMLPISQLPAVAQLPELGSVTPLLRPALN
jgi:hypothetical protein